MFDYNLTEQFCDDYLSNRLSYKELALKYNVSTATLSRVIKKLNLSRPKYNYIDIDFEQFYTDWIINNLTYDDMQKKYHCSKSKIVTYAKEHNLLKTKEQHYQNIQKTVREKYGVDYIVQSDAYKQTARQSCLQHYGVDNPAKSDTIQQKICATNMQKYGYKYTTQVPELIVQRKATNLLKYGNECTFKSDGIMAKIRQTLLLKYGFDNPSKVATIQLKKLQTNRLRYNRDHATQQHYNNETLEVLSSRESMLLFLESIDLKTASNAASALNCSLSTFLKYVHKYNLDCYLKYTGSKYEIELQNFLEELGVDNISLHNREIISPQEIDIYCPNHNIGFEFNGTYWHSTLFKDINYHRDKAQRAMNAGIRLIHVYEDDWNNASSKQIIKAMIKRALSLSAFTITTDKCICVPIDIDVAKEFYDNNALDIPDFADINYRYFGLLYDNMLVACVVVNQSNSCEIISYIAQHNDYHIIDLFDHLIELLSKNNSNNVYYEYNLDYDDYSHVLNNMKHNQNKNVIFLYKTARVLFDDSLSIVPFLNIDLNDEKVYLIGSGYIQEPVSKINK